MPRQLLPSLLRLRWPALALTAALLLTQIPRLIAAAYTNSSAVALNEAQAVPDVLSDNQAAAYARAAQSAQQALRISPDLSGPYANLGAIYLDHGYHEEAAQAYGEATRNDPDDRLAQFFYGHALAALGYEAQAREAWTAAQAGVFFAKRARDLRTSDPGAAARDAERAVDIVPDDPESTMALSSVLTAQKRYTEALTSVEAAIVRIPAAPQLHTEAGKLHRRLSQDDTAIVAFGQAISLARPDSPDDLAARLELARVYVKRGACYEAEAWLAPMLAQRPLESRAKTAYALAGQCHLAQGNVQTSLTYLEALAAVPEPRVNDLLLLGRAYEAAGRLQDARGVYSWVLALKPDNGTAKQALERLAEQAP